MYAFFKPRLLRWGLKFLITQEMSCCTVFNNMVCADPMIYPLCSKTMICETTNTKSLLFSLGNKLHGT